MQYLNNLVTGVCQLKGFTLSELLVSLAVLGLIAGLTVPSVINSVSRARNKALQKETVQVIASIIQDGMMNGDFTAITNWSIANTTDPIVQYFTRKLNASKQCPDGTLAAPCDHNWDNANHQYETNDSARWVLPNGVKIWFGIGILSPTSTAIPVLIDSKPEGTNILGGRGNTNPDQLAITCNILDTTQTIRGVMLKPRQCGPFESGNHAAQFNAL